MKNILNKYKKIVFVVIYRKIQDRLQYLILKRKLNWKGWEFPKGRVKKDESVIKTIKREIKEETGQVPYYIKKYTVIGKFDYKKLIDSKPEFVGSKYRLYSAEIKENKIKIDSNKHNDYKWVDFKTAIKHLEWKNQRDSLKIVNEKLEEIFHLMPVKPIILKKKKKVIRKETRNKKGNSRRIKKKIFRGRKR